MILLRHLKNCYLKIKLQYIIKYNDTITPSEELLVKDKTLINHQNIKSLAIKMYKAVNNLPRGILTKFFVRNNHNYTFCTRSELTF